MDVQTALRLNGIRARRAKLGSEAEIILDGGGLPGLPGEFAVARRISMSPMWRARRRDGSYHLVPVLRLPTPYFAHGGHHFQGTRKPLVMWFRAMWYVTSQKSGASALGLQRVLGLAQLRDGVDVAA